MPQFSRILTILVVALAATRAAAAVAPDIRCESGQLKAVASYASCRLKADSTALLRNETADFTKCSDKLLSKFSSLEDPPGVCPSEGDVNQVKGLSDTYEGQVAFILSGATTTTTTTTLAPTGQCGDGVVDAGEQCDVGNLNGKTCATQGFFNGTLLCAAGCTFDTSQCNATRFEDTGSTILDHQMGLEWEKKDASDGTANVADAHDVDNTYTWSTGAGGTTRIGTLFTDFLVKLNGTVNDTTKVTSGCYANHCDWRLPTIDEVKSIAILSPACSVAPCVQDSLLLPNRSGHYWSDSTRSSAPSGAYFVDFNTGTPAGDLKTNAKFIRAVRSAE